eukprot:TRINITY_DN4792_c1_g2_i1.p1 TRINITY_DN4792_c1_g2~~TRINITY_DN4792_c1_g2_i1.p1  ORF type:complete len:409 (+),score=58.29 TRINITY_DN4792_c1_g2_i1:56-1282(+)
MIRPLRGTARFFFVCKMTQAGQKRTTSTVVGNGKKQCVAEQKIHPFFKKVASTPPTTPARADNDIKTPLTKSVSFSGANDEEGTTTPLTKGASFSSARCADDLERMESNTTNQTEEGTDEESEYSLSEEEEELAKTEAAHELWQHLTDPGWRRHLSAERDKDYFRDLALKVKRERKKQPIYPPEEDVFSAFNLTPFDDVKVVILGQDPYHGPEQAHGLCFSVLPGIKPPPSLKNIYKELSADLQWFTPPSHGYLLPWAAQGVLMTNATLTVRKKQANSHAKFGWQIFTSTAIRTLSEERSDIVFLLWGGFAQKKGASICTEKHVVLKTFHPSPLSVTKWRGCRVFSKANKALKKLCKSPIDWRLPTDPNGTLEAMEIVVEEEAVEEEEESKKEPEEEKKTETTPDTKE